MHFRSQPAPVASALVVLTDPGQLVLLLGLGIDARLLSVPFSGSYQ
jgi:hypothetical protein